MVANALHALADIPGAAGGARHLLEQARREEMAEGIDVAHGSRAIFSAASVCKPPYSLSVKHCKRRQHPRAANSLMFFSVEAAREARELQQREKILEAEAGDAHPPAACARLSGLAAEHDPLLDERVDGVFLPRYRALVAQHVLQRLGAEIAGRKYHLERLSQELVE